IRYTLDGSLPTATSTPYRDALEIAAPGELRATSFAAGQPLATARRYALDAGVAQPRSSRELELCSAGLPLALEVDAPSALEPPVVQLDLMNPCWIWREVDLGTPHALLA